MLVRVRGLRSFAGMIRTRAIEVTVQRFLGTGDPFSVRLSKRS